MASSEHGLEPLSPFTGAGALERADAIEVEVPRGEPRQLLAAVADALAARAPAEELREHLAAAADALEVTEDEEVRLALAYRLALPYLARDASIREALADVEPLLEAMDEDERVERGPVLARAAAPALAVDLALLRDEGYRYVATFPPEGSEGVDVVGKAAAWLTRRMTVDRDDACIPSWTRDTNASPAHGSAEAAAREKTTRPAGWTQVQPARRSIALPGDGAVRSHG